jgi:hypothetical protein
LEARKVIALSKKAARLITERLSLFGGNATVLGDGVSVPRFAPFARKWTRQIIFGAYAEACALFSAGLERIACHIFLLSA